MKSRIYKFQGVNVNCKGRGKVETSTALKHFINQFSMRGITITCIHGDNEFEKVKTLMAPIPVECCGREEHVPDIERAIRTVKERTRCTTTALPYKKLPGIMIDSNIQEKITWLNQFPPKNYISPAIGPAGMILGTPKLNYSNLKLDFGQYCQVHDSTTNTPKSRSVGAIALRPKNSRGSYYFMSLATGKQIHSNNWVELPITQAVIDRVEYLATQEGLDDLVDGELIFEWAPGTLIRNEDDSSINHHGLHIDSTPTHHMHDEVLSPPPIFHDIQNGQYEDQGAREDSHSDDDIITTDHIPANHNTTQSEHDQNEPTTESFDNAYLANNDPFEEAASLGENEPEDDNDNDIGDITDAQDEGLDTNSINSEDIPNINGPAPSEAPTGVPNSDREVKTPPRRKRRPPQQYAPSFGGKKYSMQLFNYAMTKVAHQSDEEKVKNFDIRTNTVNLIFTQMTANQGISAYGAKAIAAIYREYKQMQDMEVLGALDPDQLSNDQKRRALRAINLIKIKRCGKVKGRMCANGAPHRKFVPREEAKSPTVSTDGLFSTAVIAAHEKRHVITFDVPGAYLHANIPDGKFRILMLEGKYVEIMCSVNPEYEQFVQIERGVKVLYLRILKALYGMIESALLWYQLFTSVLLESGFELNPYDPCIANKMIDGHQCTIAWYVDDNMISHKDQKVVEEIVGKIEESFPGLTITRGKVHTFIGMRMTFRDDRKLEVDLKDYLNEAIQEFKEELGPTVSTVAAKWLFDTNEKARKLSKDRADIFHSVVAKLLWVSQRGRPDISTPISFLCSRVSSPDVEDHKKLRRVLKFIQQTIDDTRIIGIDRLDTMLTFVDSSHAVHPDMRGHTGGLITFGTGILSPRSSKQKMNSRSSNETEVIGNSEYLPTNIWHEHFLEAQGYPIKYNYFFQDNEGAEKMAKNGRLSCGSNSRHINIKFFWISDRVKQGHVQIKRCHMDRMLADFFTKPLQGSKFHTFRRIIMGWEHISSIIKRTSEDGEPPSAKERVEKVVNKTDKSSEQQSIKNLGVVADSRTVTWADVVKNTTYQHGNKKYDSIEEKKEH